MEKLKKAEEREKVLEFFREISGRPTRRKREETRKEEMEKLKKAAMEKGFLKIADAAAVLHCKYAKAAQMLQVLASENPDLFTYERGVLSVKKGEGEKDA